MRITCGCAVGRLGQDVAAAGDAVGRRVLRRGRASAAFCRVRRSAVGRSVCSSAIRHAHAVSLASAGRTTSRPGIARSADRCSTGWWVGPSSPRPIESCVQTYDHRQLHQRGEPHRRAHVVAEDQERAAVRAGAAVQHDAVEDRAHAVLADAEVQRAAVLVAGELLGGVLRRDERRLALHRGVVALGQVGRAAPQLRQHRRERVEHLAGRGPGGDALRVGRPAAAARRSSRRAACGWSAGRRAPCARGWRRPRRRTPSCHCGVRLPAALDHLAGVGEHLVVDREASAPGRSPRIFLVAATSSAPSAEPWILPVFCLFGAGQPMIVRSAMNDGRLGLGLGRLERARTAPRRPRGSRPRRRARSASRRSARASRTPRSGPPRPRSWRCGCRPRSRSRCRRRSR